MNILFGATLWILLFLVVAQGNPNAPAEVSITADGIPLARTTFTTDEGAFGCCREQGVYARPATWQWVISPITSHPVDYLTLSIPWLSFTNNRDTFRIYDGISLTPATKLLSIEGNNNRYKVEVTNSTLPEVVVEFVACKDCGPSRLYGDGGFELEYYSTYCPVCYEGTLVDCECRCNQGWSGRECDRCDSDRFCFGHGTCGKGYVCDCEPGYLGDNCEITCVAEVDCNGHGTCDAAGGCDCDAASGYYGEHCLCPVFNTCNDTVVDHGECVELAPGAFGFVCDEGFGGCECECEDEVSCSGHGTCAEEGCDCEVQYQGEHCEDIDLQGYCRLSLNGFECFPGLEHIGIGYDITKGQFTERIRALEFRIEDSVIDLGPPYLKRELPVDVRLQPGPFEFSKDVFLVTSPLDYAHSMSMGLRFQDNSQGFVLSDAIYREGMFIEDPRVTTGIPYTYWSSQFIGRQQRVFSDWSLYYDADMDPSLRPEFQAALDDLPPFYTAAVQSEYFAFFGRFGTHFTKGIELGGQIIQDVAISKCIFQTEGRTAVRNALIHRLDQQLYGSGVARDPRYPSLLSNPSTFPQYISASFVEVKGGNMSLLAQPSEHRHSLRQSPALDAWKSELLTPMVQKYDVVMPRFVKISEAVTYDEDLQTRLDSAYIDYIKAAYNRHKDDAELQTPPTDVDCSVFATQYQS